MRLFERVLVAVDAGPGGVELLHYARALAGVLGDAEFSFVHVLGWSSHSQFRSAPTTHAQALQRLNDDVVFHFGTGRRTRCLVLHGNIVDSMLETAAELGADLILVGHTAEHSGRRSLARRLAMQAPCSVWMKPSAAPLTLRRVLAAVDYSGHSAYALSIAGHIARRAGAEQFQALHVFLNEAGAMAEEYRATDRAREREAFARFTAPLDTAAVEVEPVLVEGASVADTVNRMTETTPLDLVVMGSRGQSRSASILLGSESEGVMMESKIPVLIAKRRGERIGLLQALLDRSFHLQEPPRFG
jgi:nucleotide-binding universal stress UspA family protein